MTAPAAPTTPIKILASRAMARMPDADWLALFSRARFARLLSYASTQVGVQALGFLAGIVLVRSMAQEDYGQYTLAVTMIGLAAVLLDLGLSTALLAIAGPLHARPGQTGAVLGDAIAVHKNLAFVLVPIMLVGFGSSLLAQGLSLAQSLALLGLVMVCATLQVRCSLWIAVVRLRGDLRLQQKLELGVNAGKLLAILGAALVLINAYVALALNATAMLAMWWVLHGYVARSVGQPPVRTRRFDAPLLALVRKQAPNSLYYCLSGQAGVWLVGWFGGTDRLAEVGALGRLAVLFTVVGAVVIALVQPFFARSRRPRELISGFIALNGFFAVVSIALVALASLAPGLLLWVLGPRYGDLKSELVWMVLGASLSAWSGAVYAVGAGRTWILPTVPIIIGGVGSMALTASLVDLSTVIGGLMVNTASALVATVLTIVFVSLKLRTLHREPAERQEAEL